MFTYFSTGLGVTSWLDHVVSTGPMHNVISDIQVEYGYVTSDHCPVSVTIDTEVPQLKVDSVQKNNVISKVRWDKISAAEREVYRRNTDIALDGVKLNYSVLSCRDATCKNSSHVQYIHKLYEDICMVLAEAGDSIQPGSKTSKCNSKAGWNTYCKELHSQARESFLHWRCNGSPRSGILFQAMKITRARFKLMLRKCKHDNQVLVSDSLAKKLLLKDTKAFWKEVKHMNHKDITVQATTIDGVTGSENICNMWHDHFKNLLNSSTDTGNKNRVLSELSGIENTTNEQLINASDIEECLHKLKKGKSPGSDGISSEHLMYAGKRISFFLTCLFNTMLIHGCLPRRFMETILVTLVKDKKGLLTDKDNYRPIAITSAMSKLLETVILYKHGDLFSTSAHQFGFKKQHSTDMCIFVMKEVIDYYNSLSSPVYACYIDASKAFDRINHWTLFRKLLDRNIPRLFVRLLSVWYSTQTFSVTWDGCLSKPFYVSNGVRQGGVLSPQLFNVYMDELTECLVKTKVGCFYNSVCVNHLYYADDAVLLAPTVSSLQILVGICEAYAVKCEITYSVKKSVCCAFVPNTYSDLYLPSVFLNNRSMSWVTENKYLGVLLCSNCTDDVDILRQTQALYRQGNFIVHKFKHCTDDVKLLLFIYHCTNMYGPHLWSRFSSKNLDRLKVAYNNIFRQLLKLDPRGSISAKFLFFNVNSFPVLYRKLVYGFYQRVIKSQNVLMSTIGNSPYFIYRSSLYTQWNDVLL